jgi:hypothetical protein
MYLNTLLSSGSAAQKEVKLRVWRDFNAYMQSFPDVWIVTNQDLIRWVQKPVVASEMASFINCKDPRPIVPGGAIVAAGGDGSNGVDSSKSTDGEAVKKPNAAPGLLRASTGDILTGMLILFYLLWI